MCVCVLNAALRNKLYATGPVMEFSKMRYRKSDDNVSFLFFLFRSIVPKFQCLLFIYLRDDWKYYMGVQSDV